MNYKLRVPLFAVWIVTAIILVLVTPFCVYALVMGDIASIMLVWRKALALYLAIAVFVFIVAALLND